MLIEARAEPIHLEVDIPGSAPSVQIVAGGRSLLHRAGERVVRQASPASDGTYLIPLAPAASTAHGALSHRHGEG